MNSHNLFDASQKECSPLMGVVTPIHIHKSMNMRAPNVAGDAVPLTLVKSAMRAPSVVGNGFVRYACSSNRQWGKSESWTRTQHRDSLCWVLLPVREQRQHYHAILLCQALQRYNS